MFKKCSLQVISIVTVFFCLPANAGLDRASKMGMVAHKAIYDIHLSTKKSSANISNITGKMFYEWKPSCDAWLSTHKLDLIYEYTEIPPMRVTSDFSTYESFDGKIFNFTLQRKRDGMVFEEIRGSANNDSKEAIYSLPKSQTFKLPKGTLFPTAHTLMVLDKIKNGKTFYKASIFDGSDDNGSTDISSFILSKAETYSPKLDNNNYLDKELLNIDSWNVRLAFFPLDNVEVTSDYEMSIIFHKNGVISNMEVDYGDFSVSQKLIALEPLDDDCLTGIYKR